MNIKINNNLNSKVNYAPGSSLIQNSRNIKDSKINKPKKPFLKIIVFLILLIVGVGGIVYYRTNKLNTASYASSTVRSEAVKPKPVILASNVCENNTLAKKVVVVIDQQHLYACQFNKTVFNSAVITGYQRSPENITPVGNYTLFKKFTNVNLTGEDDLGSWNVHVSYWMPFLFNQYGAYGFHDATWRTPNDFGHISPTSTNASHGCVECPLATAKWLYYWFNVGTNITIENQA